MLAAIVAAVMSTCDTTVMTITTQIVFDLYGGVIAPAMGKNPDDKKMKKACSWMSWILMGIALLLAFGFNDIITVLPAAIRSGSPAAWFRSCLAVSGRRQPVSAPFPLCLPARCLHCST